ncbi:MAG: MoaD/ThiS family protein [Bacillota bacterium]|nr:MoaD/ThiS family protein [Bacillota bacterium]
MFIKITVEIHGFLAGKRERHRTLSCDEPLTVRQLIDLLEIEPDDVGTVIVNHKLRDESHILHDGDHILIAPFLQGG